MVPVANPESSLRYVWVSGAMNSGLNCFVARPIGEVNTLDPAMVERHSGRFVWRIGEIVQCYRAGIFMPNRLRLLENVPVREPRVDFGLRRSYNIPVR